MGDKLEKEIINIILKIPLKKWDDKMCTSVNGMKVELFPWHGGYKSSVDINGQRVVDDRLEVVADSLRERDRIKDEKKEHKKLKRILKKLKSD